MTPEGSVLKDIEQYLKKLRSLGNPVLYERRQAGGFSYKKGMPDLYIIYNGIHIEIEVKRPGGHQSTMQEKWQKIFKDNNVICECIDNVNDLKKILSEIEIK